MDTPQTNTPAITNEALLEIVKKQGEQIDQLTKMVSAKQETSITVDAAVKVPTLPTDAVDVNGKQYKLNFASFRLPDSSTIILASEAAVDEELLKTIVAIPGQNVLKEQV
jgi:hypothetical protein